MAAPKDARKSGSKRFYSWRNENHWSVTTIIDGAIPKRALIYWAANEVAEYAIRAIGKDPDWLPPKKR